MKDWFQGLERREQWVLVGGGVILTLALSWTLLIEPLYSGVNKAAARVEDKASLLTWMEHNASRIQGVPAAGQSLNSNQSMVVIVGQTTRAAGLEQHLKQNQPAGSDSIRVRFEGAPFDNLVQWIGRLQADFGLQIQSASFDRASVPGTADARITLERSGS